MTGIRKMIKELAWTCGLYAPGDSEKDPEFREVIERHARVGMHLAAALAIFGPTFAVSISVVVFNQPVTMLYFPGGPEWALWDETLIVALGLLALALSRTRFGPRWGRLLVATFIIVMSSSMVIDSIICPRPVVLADIGTPFTMTMLIAIGTMPYRAWQAFMLGAVMGTLHLTIAGFLPGAIGQEEIPRLFEGVVMTSMITIFCTLISALIYAGRWQQYLARKQTEGSERKYRSLFENATDAIFVIENATGRLVHVNPTFEELFGITAAELRKTHFTDLIDPDDRERVVEHHRMRLAGGPAPMRYTLRVRNPRWSESLTCDLTIHRTDDPDFTRGTLRDITERIRAEEKIRTYARDLEATNRELRETQAQLVQSEKMAALGNLVAGVAHEINTPIGSIHANADVSRRALELIHSALESGGDAASLDLPKVRRAVDILSEANTTTCTATERIVRIVKSLRNFARLDEAEVKAVDVHEGIESTLTLVYHEYKHRIEVVREFAELPKIECYPNQLNQVFMNILVNAIHAIQGEGKITISTRAVGDNVQIDITDTGKGIPKEHLDRIFDPGFTTKGVGVGTGLGLSIVYKIVQAHRGKIDVDSTVGVGTTFTIALPIKGLEAANRNSGGKG